jgi:hypothetical protein
VHEVPAPHGFKLAASGVLSGRHGLRDHFVVAVGPSGICDHTDDLPVSKLSPAHLRGAIVTSDCQGNYVEVDWFEDSRGLKPRSPTPTNQAGIDDPIVRIDNAMLRLAPKMQRYAP